MANSFSHLASIFVLNQIQDLTLFITQDEQFFATNATGRNQKLQVSHVLFATVLKNYLEHVDEAQYVSDAKALVYDCSVGELRAETELTSSIMKYLLAGFVTVLHEFVTKLDTISQQSWILAHEQRTAYIDSIPNLKLYEKIWLKQYSYQELCDNLYHTIKLFSPDMHMVLIQTARECPQKIKQSIRKAYPNTLAIFTVQSNILGGMRIMIDGKLIDDSWVNKLVRLQTIASNNT